jgi:hypothetical protein
MDDPLQVVNGQGVPPRTYFVPPSIGGIIIDHASSSET